MIKNYEIEKLNYENEYPYVIFSTSFINPIEEIDEIEEELRWNFKGKVIFDLLLSNGVSSNRFIEANFDGEKFDYTSFKSLKDVDSNVVQKSTDFYRRNSWLLKNSILPKSYQFLIGKGKLV